MPVKLIIHYPDERLRQPCVPVEDFKAEDVKQLLEDMVDTARSYKAQGLAANQIGGKYRIFVARTEDGEYQEFINPELELEGEVVQNHEGCLSFPGATVLVSRPEECTVTASNKSGESFTYYFDGVEAVAAQHEADHLDGVLVVDKISRLTKHMFLKKVGKYHKRYTRNVNMKAFR